MRDLRQMQDDFFAMEMISGDLDKKKDGDEDGGTDGASSGGHDPSGGSGGGNPSSGGCLAALILLPVMPMISLLKDLFF